MKKNETFQAAAWVIEWMKAIEKHPETPTDKDIMLSWFVAVLMAGYDYACQDIRKDINKKCTTKEAKNDINS